MAFDGDFVPVFFDFSVGADQKSASDNAEERFAEEFFHTANAVGFDGVKIRIAKQIEIQFVLRFETGLGFDGVAAHPKYHRV